MVGRLMLSFEILGLFVLEMGAGSRQRWGVSIFIGWSRALQRETSLMYIFFGGGGTPSHRSARRDGYI